jgi:predicted lipid-binding transport protein (Tim44 family)
MDIIIFALIAAFLIYRLYAILGARHGDERARPNPFAPSGPARQQEQRPRTYSAPPAPPKPASLPNPEAYVDKEADSAGRVTAGLNDIAAADSAFDPGAFLQGARRAFEIVVASYAKGDLAALEHLLSPRLLSDFKAGVTARAQKGLTSQAILHRIKSARISEAHLGGVMAYVTVLFQAEETLFTRDASGAVVEGSPDRIVEVEDVWTFTRDTRAADPNWILVETRAPPVAGTQ